MLAGTTELRAGKAKRLRTDLPTIVDVLPPNPEKLPEWLATLTPPALPLTSSDFPAAAQPLAGCRQFRPEARSVFAARTTIPGDGVPPSRALRRDSAKPNTRVVLPAGSAGPAKRGMRRRAVEPSP